MKRIATVTLLLVLAGGVLAAGPDEDYVAIYNQIQQADTLDQAHQWPAAAARYQQAYEALRTFSAEHPSANVAAVKYRLEYLAEKLQEKELAPYVSLTNAVAVPAKPATPVTPQQQSAMLQEEIRALTNANAQLEMQLRDAAARLKEALSVQPAAVAPGELDKARAQIVALEKERDLLRVSLDQQKAAAAAPPAPTEADKAAQAENAGLKEKLDEVQRKLNDATAELNNLKSRPPPPPPPAAENLQQLTAERDRLKAQLAVVSKELADSEAHANSAAAASGADAARLKAAEAERDDLKKQVAALAASAGSGAEVERLRARLAVLEAAAVPYTAEELAVLKSSPPARMAAPPTAVKEPPPQAHSAKDLSAGARSIMQDAHLDAMARRYDDAEKKCLEVLKEDANNLYVLYTLGSAQLSAGRPDDCEKTVQRALAVDPNDPGSLYLLGILRFSQEKLDDALDALSRSAAQNSTNAGTQFYLGSVLADKGLGPQAETALRKALDIDPAYADAHFRLATVYASGKPPSLALARWHYQRALDLGHEKSDKLEKMLSDGN
jgi:tetratricopeptide (TPR) repeat protein